MGCGQSTAAAEAIDTRASSPGASSPPPVPRKVDGSNSTKEQAPSSTTKSADNINDDDNDNGSATPKSALQRRADFAVRPGYSSGASSYDGSITDDDEDDFGAQLQTSRHSDILALDTLKQEMVADGDLTKNVVRIEPCYGQPIQDVYDGVQDGDVLGSGVSGIVRLVTHKATKVKYAVKVLELGLIDSTEGLKQLRNEIFIMCQLDHPNIVRIEEVYESTNEIYIVQELCLGGDLFDRLDEQPDYHYTEAQCARLVKQMLSAVRYLHSKGIIHRDLKLENFLFSTPDPQSELRMIDFGLSKHFIAGEHHHEKVGTPYTVAPEIIQGHYDEKSDIWALGVITYLLLSGETPFGGLDGEHPLQVKQNIQRAELLFEPADLWESVSSDAVSFVKRCLVADPQKRPTAKIAQKDDWIQVWAKKDAKAGNRINPKTIGALMAFKEQSDMQKLLSEVLSFTLLPEQIVELREAFEKIDKDGDGEISLNTMKEVLLRNAEAGALGGLTESEIETLFEAIRVRKSEPTIRWHEFLAAGLSQAKIDDRNLRLAFDRMDTTRKGYITLQDLRDMLGNSADAESLEQVWLTSLNEIQVSFDRITYEDFKRLMKGQSQGRIQSSKTLGALPEQPRTGVLGPVPEEMSSSLASSSPDFSGMLAGTDRRSKNKRSHSYGAGTSMWGEMDDFSKEKSGGIMTPLAEESKELENESPLVVNRALYRRHREMRLAVLDASKQFDNKRTNRENQQQAGLVMKRGAKPPVEIQDQHNRAMFEAAARRCGRTKRTRKKTVSDVTGMMMSS
mmetsp:Transcript_20890/g.45316  ORF Transcript_20890/g.45316 Transcript_20890/m.45316 type:complete len:791 (-) Transcript_20890:118-2490(-)|eukprot:CAMPEP_0168733924 /NCGR_PEP_ID=MMETSP0724-20121128/8547_1 /TAXON_ID=265536 /ORGANISM="Amphiprora sp., Strain CCMP467" /LENGTH=790 /DNA_ID=CAMNT_0008781009 /DNA_START=63 /DNA_END=2438 /DNA_ORIENTATION=-